VHHCAAIGTITIHEVNTAGKRASPRACRDIDTVPERMTAQRVKL